MATQNTILGQHWEVSVWVHLHKKEKTNFMDHCVRTNFIATEWKILVTQHIKKMEYHDFGWKTLYLSC